MTTNSTDIDAVGTLITTEWGNPPQSQPAGVPNFQGYGASGQGIEEVYPYLYNPTVDVPPLDESEGGLALQEQEWVEEVELLQDEDPDYLEGADITGDVVFENPLDTLSAADTSAQERSAGENDVDYDRVTDAGFSDTPSFAGVTEGAEEDTAVTDAQAEDAAFASGTTGEGTEGTVVYETPVVAPEQSGLVVNRDETQE